MTRLAILASGGGWHVQDLLRAARARDIQPELLDFRRLTAQCPEQTNTLANYHAVLVRTMPAGSLEQVVFRMDALAGAEQSGVRVVNSPKALEACIDKYVTTHRLAIAGLPVPRTWVGEKAEAAMDAFQDLGGDVVVKPLFGSEGRGMVRVSDPDLAWRVFAAIERTQGVIYQQEFIRHDGSDLRVFVLGGRVLAAMRRFAKNGWRTNVAQGGRAEPATISEEDEDLALFGARAVHCEVAGVDILGGSDRSLVIEVNAVPGWRALRDVCAVDVAGAILDFVRSSAGD